MPLQNIIRLFQTIKKLPSAQEFSLEILSGDTTRKSTEQQLSFLQVILLLDLILCPYHILSNYLKQCGSYSLHKISALEVIAT